MYYAQYLSDFDFICTTKLYRRENARLKRTSFTLIELMIVIAIIAVLAQMLIPVFRMAKERSMELECLLNIRQINSAITLYSEDFNYYPCGNTATFNYAEPLKSYLNQNPEGIPSIFECPCATHSIGNTVWMSYAVHPVIMPDFTQNQKKFWRVGQIKRISEIFSIMESCQTVNSHCYPTLKSIPRIFYTAKENSKNKLIFGNFDSHDMDCVDTNAGWPRFRHRFRTATTGFFDGHVGTTRINTMVHGNVKTNY